MRSGISCSQDRAQFVKFTTTLGTSTMMFNMRVLLGMHFPMSRPLGVSPGPNVEALLLMSLGWPHMTCSTLIVLSYVACLVVINLTYSALRGRPHHLESPALTVGKTMLTISVIWYDMSPQNVRH